MGNNRLRWVTIVLGAVACGGIGCEPPKPSATIIPTRPALDATKQIENTDYVSWAKHPIGTKVVRQKVMSNENGKTVITTSLQLVGVKLESVVVDRQITVERNCDKTINPVESVEYGAKYSIPKDMDEKQFRSPVPDAKLLGSETITVNGQAYSAEIYEWESMLESGPMEVKGWFSDKFPGRQIQLVFHIGDESFKEETILVESNVPSLP